MNAAKRIIIEYEDGTRKEVAFERLSAQSQAELATIGAQSAAPAAGKAFLLLQWKDGWREVIAMDEPVAEILRYYTLERVEEIGRLSLETADENPKLVFVKRLPARVEKVLYVDEKTVQAYTLEEKVTVKEGGKTERILYDKKRPDFKKEEGSVSSARYNEVLDSVKAELEKKGKSASALLAMDNGERVSVLKELSQALGIKGAERQHDVYAFIQAAAKKLRAN